jgi:chlorobactene glucosyltransferase
LAFACAGSAAALGIQIGTARHFRAPWAYGLLFPLGYVVAAAIALNAVRLARAERVTWKGRTYSPAR